MWDITVPSTYQHPMAPYDVLVDPLSMPSHPILLTQKQEEDEDSKASESTDGKGSHSTENNTVICLALFYNKTCFC